MSDDRRLTEELHESLRRRAAGFAPEPAAMDEVVHRARGIRRRRRAAASLAAVAAVAAIAVPTGLTLGGPQAGREPGPAHSGSVSPSVPHSTAPATTSPTPTTPSTPSASPDATGQQQALTLAGIKAGGSVDVGWLEGSTWHNGQGGTATLPQGTYEAITPYRGGFLVVQPREQTDPAGVSSTHLSWLDNTMKPAWSTCGSSRLAVSGDQMMAAYSKLSDCGTTATDTLHVGIANGMSDSETVRDVPAGKLAEPVGQTDQVLVYNLRDLLAGDMQGAWYADLGQQQPPKQVPGLAYASGVNTARQQVSGASATQQGTGVVVDAATGKVLWSQKDWWPGQFSADGKYVVASHSAGGEPDAYAVLDAATGNVVQRLDLTRYGMQVTATAWNPDDSLLLLVHQGDKQAVVRLALDGTVTRASDVMPADPAHAVVFAAQP